MYIRTVCIYRYKYGSVVWQYRSSVLSLSLCSSMVIRDLTLRSAASFGSFHLIRLLYDEYMFYLIEHKVAKSSGKTPIAVLSEVCTYIQNVHTAFLYYA